jgi:hypothetical protein
LTKIGWHIFWAILQPTHLGTLLVRTKLARKANMQHTVNFKSMKYINTAIPEKQEYNILSNQARI